MLKFTTILPASRTTSRLFLNRNVLNQIRFQSTVSDLKTLNDFNVAIKAENLSVVDFFATWCGPCRMLSPYFKKFSSNYQDVKFYKVDVDECPQIAQVMQVRAMPTIILFKGGKPVETVVGANPGAIRDAIEQHK